MKTKFLSLLLVLCIVVGCTGITALASTDAKIELYESLGKISIDLTGADTHGGELIVGFFDQYDKACMVKNYKAYDGITYSLTAPDNAERVKVMWVKSFKSLKPVCPPAEKSITKSTVTEIDVNLIDIYSDISNGYIEYYETEEAAKTTKIYVSPTALICVNGVLYNNGFSSALSFSSYKDATVKFVENTQDKYCDIIDFTIYDYYYVEEVNISTDRIVFGGVSGKSVTFTDFLEDPSYTIEFKDKDGKDIEIADFKAGDIIGVVAADVGKCKPSPTNNVVTYYNLGENSVTGMITALNTNKNTVWINEEEYAVVGKTVGASSGFKLGDEGKYLLTKTGKIFDCYETYYDIAYILDAHYNNSGIDAGTLEFKILTDDNEIVIVDVASRFTYSRSDGTSNSNVSVETTGTYIENIYQASGTATQADRLVKYKLNSSNELRSIEAFSIYDTAQLSNARWNANINTLGGNELTEEALVFAIDTYDADNSFVTSISALDENIAYTGMLAEFNENTLAFSAAVIVDGIEAEEKEDVLTEYDYGYILDAYYNNSGIAGGVLQFRILTAGNEIETVNTTLKFTYTKADSTKVANVSIENDGASIEALYKASGMATKADRLVKYTLNSESNLRSVEAYTTYTTITDGTWNTETYTIDSYTLDKDAKIFAIDTYDLDNSFVTSISAFKEEGAYTGLLAGYSENKLAHSAAVIINGIEAEEQEDILTEYDYGFVLDAYFDNSGIDAGTVQFQLLTADNEIVIVNATPRFTYAKADGTTVRNAIIDEEGNTIENTYSSYGPATVADRLVKYKLTSKNELRSVEAYTDNCAISSGAWIKDINTLFDNKLTTDAKIFAIDSSNAEKSYVTSISALSEENYYMGMVADYNDNDMSYSVAVVDRANMGGISKAQGIAIVKEVIPSLYNGEEAIMLTVYKDNNANAQKIYFTTDDSCTPSFSVLYNQINPGSVLLYTANEKGLVTDYSVLATYNNTNCTLTPSMTGIASSSGVTANGNTYQYDYGFIDRLVDNKIVIKGGNTYKASDCNMYTYEYRGGNSVVTVDDYTAGNVDIYDYETNKANFVFLKLENSRVTDIYTISNRANYTSSIITQSTDLK